MKRTILLLLFFVLIFGTTASAQSETLYIHDFYIIESGNLTASERAQINKTARNIKEYFKATLKGNYDILPKIPLKMTATTLKGTDVSYRNDTDYMVFGTAAYDDDINYLSVSVYLYEVLDNGYLKETHSHTSEGTVDTWNNRELRLEKIEEVLKNVFPDIQSKQVGNKKEPKKIKEPKKPKKVKEPKKIKEPKKPKKVKEPKKTKEQRNKQVNIPAIGIMTTGALMGGTGIYLRSKALKSYDDYEGAVDEDLPTEMLDTKLKDARKPNRTAHIIGAGGILVTGIGTYLWLSRRSKNNNTTTHFQRINIAPHIEYNINSNHNTFHAKMTYTF